jgi:sec-independent protein translocase protein TatA
MFGLGAQELIIILIIIIVLFGSTRIPQIGKGLGEGIKNFKKGLRQDEGTDLDEKSDNKTR